MKLSGFLMAFIGFGVILVGLLGATGSMANNYDVDTSDTLDTISGLGSSAISTTKSESEGMKTIINNPFAGIPGFEQAWGLGVVGFKAIQTLFSLLSSITQTIVSLGGILPVPTFISDGITALFTVFFLFSIVSAAFGRNV
jgi:hypothetical protein